MSAGVRRAALSGRAQLGVAALLCAAAALLTMWPLDAITGPDPNAWLTWSHSLVGGHGIDFRFGPAWKPLPVFTTVPLGLLGNGFAAGAWLFIVRFSLFWCSGALFLLVRREAGLLAAVVAAVLPFTIRPWVNVGVAGESETVALALVLTAGLAHLGGRRLTAVSLLTLAGLSRPEVWPLIVLYIAWRAKAGERDMLVAGAASVAVLVLSWVVLPKALDTSGGAFGSTSGHSLHDASLRTIVDNTLGVIPPKAWVLIPFGLVGAWMNRRWTILVLAIGAAALVIEITLLWALHPPISQTGYTPVLRYFAAVGVLLCGVAGQGGETLRDLFPKGAARMAGSALVVLIVAWSLVASVDGTRNSINRAKATAKSTDGAVAAVSAAGGVERIKACFPATFSNFSAISWDVARRLGIPLSDTTTKPHAPSVSINFTGGGAFLETPAPKFGGRRQVLGASPGWRVDYFPGRRGCLPAARG